MEGATWENIKMTKSMAMEFTSGLMEGCTLDIGNVVNNMDSESIGLLKPTLSTVFGRRAKGLSGSIKR